MSRDSTDPLINEGNLRSAASAFPLGKFLSHLPQSTHFSEDPPIWQTQGQEANLCPLKKGRMLQSSGNAPFPISALPRSIWLWTLAPLRRGGGPCPGSGPHRPHQILAVNSKPFYHRHFPQVKSCYTAEIHLNGDQVTSLSFVRLSFPDDWEKCPQTVL